MFGGKDDNTSIAPLILLWVKYTKHKLNMLSTLEHPCSDINGKTNREMDWVGDGDGDGHGRGLYL